MQRTSFIVLIALLTAFLLFTCSVKCYDKAAIGPNSSVVGYSALNYSFRQATISYAGKDKIAYALSKYLFLIALATAPFYALIGLRQLARRFRFGDISPQIWMLAAGYVVIAVVYCIFEVCVINYRPILEADGTLEASYPSSHTFLAMTLLGMSAISYRSLFKKWKTPVTIAHIVIAATIIIGRALSGVHWLTDIIGGILLAATLLFAFASIKKWQPRQDSNLD